VFSLWIGLRYLVSQRLAIIAATGVAVGVAALVVVLGVMAGFEQDLMTRIRGGLSSILVTHAFGQGIEDYRHITAQLENLPQIAACSPRIERSVMLTVREDMRQATCTVRLIGIEPEAESRAGMFENYLRQVDLDDFQKWEAIVGTEVRPGWIAKHDTVEIASLVNSQAYLPIPRFPSVSRRLFQVAGFYKSGWVRMDEEAVYVPLKAAQILLRMRQPDRVTTLGIRPAHGVTLEEAKAAVVGALAHQKDLKVETWREARKKLLTTMKLEKRMELLGILLITVVAGFNIRALMGMMVAIKKKDIGVLRALGASRRQIAGVFLTCGSIISIGGALVGIAAGCAVALHINELEALVYRYTGFRPFPSDLYYLEQGIPVKLSSGGLLASVAVLAVAMGLISTFLPALHAWKLLPVEAIQDE